MLWRVIRLRRHLGGRPLKHALGAIAVINIFAALAGVGPAELAQPAGKNIRGMAA